MKPKKINKIPEFIIDPNTLYVIGNSEIKKVYAYGKDISFDNGCLVCKQSFLKERWTGHTLRHDKNSYMYGVIVYYRQNLNNDGKFRTNYYNIEPADDSDWTKFIGSAMAREEIKRLVKIDNDKFMEELSKRSIFVQIWYLGTIEALQLQFKKCTDVIMYMDAFK